MIKSTDKRAVVQIANARVFGPALFFLPSEVATAVLTTPHESSGPAASDFRPALGSHVGS